MAGLGLVVACCIVALGAGNLRRTELAAEERPVPARHSRTVLSVARQLQGHKTPRRMALTAAKAFSTIESLCGAASGQHAAAMDRYRKRADAK